MNWQPLFAAFERVERIKARCHQTDDSAPAENQKWRDATVKSGGYQPPEVADELSYLTLERNSRPERVHSAECTFVSTSYQKEGIQREPVERPSTNSHRRDAFKLVGGTDTCGLNTDEEQTTAAEDAVEADLRRHGALYGAVLGWPELERHWDDAVAAEGKEKGSGAKLILARFAEKKATGT